MMTVKVSQLSHELHMELARIQPVCFLVLDPDTRSLLADGPTQRAPDSPSGLDASMTPQLIKLNSETFSGSSALVNSLDAALEELAPEALLSGGGRQVCAWLRCDAAVADEACEQALLLHMSRSLTQTRNGREVLLRWHDPAVLWTLWPILQPEQRLALLGPIQTIWLLDPAGQLVSLHQPPITEAAVTHQSTQLDLSADQWRDIDHIGALNTALLQSRAATRGYDLECLRHDVLTALRRARVQGFNNQQDLAAFARLAITVHAQFDQHVEVRKRVTLRQSDDCFTNVIDDLTPEHWRRIRRECNTIEPA